MICSKCNKRIKKSLIKCPYCGARIINKDEFDLPQLKEEKDNEPVIELTPVDYNLSDNPYEVELKDDNNDSEDFDKFEGIDNVEDSMVQDDLLLGETKRIVLENESTLMDDISNQIDNMSHDINEEEKIDDILPKMKSEDDTNIINENIKDEDTSDEMVDDENNINSDASVRKRKKIFVISVISMLFLLLVGFSLYNFWSKSDGNNTKPYDSTDKIQSSIDKALDSYYESKDKSELLQILEDIKNDTEQVEKAQEAVKKKCEEWIDAFYHHEIKNKEELLQQKDNINSLLQDLYTYVNVKNDKDNNVKAITENDYNILLDKINKVYDDSLLYFDSIDYLNKKEYNKAYATFDKIDSNNRYYSRVNGMKEKIETSVIDLLKKDIDKMSSNIDTLSDKSKLNRYIQIQEIILEYKKIYHSINLEDNNDYKELMNYYSNMIDELSKKEEVQKKEETTNNSNNEVSNENVPPVENNENNENNEENKTTE